MRGGKERRLSDGVLVVLVAFSSLPRLAKCANNRRSSSCVLWSTAPVVLRQGGLGGAPCQGQRARCAAAVESRVLIACCQNEIPIAFTSSHVPLCSCTHSEEARERGWRRHGRAACSAVPFIARSQCRCVLSVCNHMHTRWLQEMRWQRPPGARTVSAVLFCAVSVRGLCRVRFGKLWSSCVA